jgi:hypothetical protein
VKEAMVKKGLGIGIACNCNNYRHMNAFFSPYLPLVFEE